MTIKLKEDTDEACMWAIDMMLNLARYTYTQERFFDPFEYVSGGGKSLHTLSLIHISEPTRPEP